MSTPHGAVCTAAEYNSDPLSVPIADPVRVWRPYGNRGPRTYQGGLGQSPQRGGWVVFLYGPPTNCYAAYTVLRRKIVFICSASYAVYTVITRKIGFI